MQPRAPELIDIRFHNPRLAGVGVEVMSLRELRERASARELATPQRVDFHQLLLIEEGRGSHTVDFVDHGLRPGSVVLVRAGQVQRWRLAPGLQGQLALVSPEALLAPHARGSADLKLLALDDWRPASQPSAPVFGTALADIARLRADIEAFAAGEVEAAIIRHQLLALLLRLVRELRGAHPPAAGRETAIHRLFMRELEATLGQRLSVLDYARRLGYSESTLSRACLAAVGHTAKEAVDRRVALEAKRLLAHGDEPAAHIGHRLGFSEATNFAKFFRRMAGMTPQAFRDQARGG